MTIEVLVVSSDALLGSWLLRTMAEVGWEARASVSLAAAAATARRCRPDLVVVDVAAADLVGPVADAIFSCGAQVVVVTTRRVEHEVEAALSAGAAAYVRWPVGPHELIARLRAVARRPAPPARADLANAVPVIVIGTLVLDRQQQTLRSRDIPIQVSGLEYTLIERLMLTAPHVVSREVLARSLSRDDPDGARLDLHLRRVRNRLEQVEGWRRIETVRGVGFRLLAEPMLDRRPAFTVSTTVGHEPFGSHREPVEP